ncbi:MAG: hypothetical protein KF851_04535 [Pirellulaceae bacterium]|nr:hypothetical protein [Pirellulaceae bacterium]
MLNDLPNAPISDSWRYLFEFIDLVCRDSNAVDQAAVDRAKQAGWSDEALYDAISVCALFKFYNTWIDATGVQDMPAAAYAASGKRLAEHGYNF